MTNRQLFLLGAVALVMVVLTAVITMERPETDKGFLRGSYLVQGVDLEKVETIYLEREGESLKLDRVEGRFVIRDKGGYPALSERVNHVFMTVAGIRVDELVTDNPENHAILGVDGGEKSTVVRFLDDAGEPLVGVVIGDRKSDEQGIRMYVRLEDDDKVYLSDQIIPFISTDFGGYIRENIFEGDKTRYVRLKLRNEKGSVEILREGGDFTVLGLQGSDGIDEEEIEDLYNEALSMRIVDISPETGIDGVTYDAFLTVTRDDEIYFQVALGAREGRCYVKAEADADFGDGKIAIYQDESDESLREKEALLRAAEAVDSFNELHKGWVYEVDESYLSFIEKDLLELLRQSL